MWHLKMIIPRYELFDTICYIIATGLSLVLFITFLWAYFVDDYWFIVKINSISEAHFELLLLCSVMLILFYNLILKFKNIKKKL